MQNHVRAMHTGHLEQYFKYITPNIGLKTINWYNFRTLLSVTNLNIFALGGYAPNRIKCKKKSVEIIMLPHCAVKYFNNNKIFIYTFFFNVSMIMLPRASGGTRAWVADPWSSGSGGCKNGRVMDDRWGSYRWTIKDWTWDGSVVFLPFSILSIPLPSAIGLSRFRVRGLLLLGTDEMIGGIGWVRWGKEDNNIQTVAVTFTNRTQMAEACFFQRCVPAP